MMITKDGVSITLSGRSCVAPVGRLPAEDLNRVYFYSIFPNLLLSLHPDYVMFHTLWPDGPGRTRITCDWLFHPDSFEIGRASCRERVLISARDRILKKIRLGMVDAVLAASPRINWSRTSGVRVEMGRDS